ncbi:hypothetical protein KO525_06780 [Psychrosphaera sp. B3R10]|nr:MULTISPECIES: hypothetical protein [unclassified Psychrosphaera]MBU2882402.1 hypothetical protein [Psychrosphaera sp. I2R16]MBU2989083.1 hypothetical protein [Psychrosphaera sp. B3R10]
MKKMKLHSIAAAVSLTIGMLAMTSTGAIAGSKHKDHENRRNVEKNIVKVVSESGDGVEVYVLNKDVKKEYNFSFDELDSMDNVSAKLGDLDSDTQSKIVELLGQLKDHDAKHVVIKSAEIAKGDKETEVYMIRTADGEENVHIEIDVEGEGAGSEKRMFIHKMMEDGKKGHHDRGGKRNSKEKGKMSKKKLKHILKHLVKTEKLDEAEKAELRAILDGQ